MSRPAGRQRIRLRLLLLLMTLSTSAFVEGTTKVFRVGYSGGAFSEVRLADVQIALEVWTTKLGHKLSRTTEKVTAVIYHNLQEIELAVRSGDVDMVVLGSLDYLQLENNDGLDPVLVGAVGENVEMECVVLTRKDKNIHNVQDLRNRVLYADTGGNGDLPVLWLDTVLLKAKLPGAGRLLASLKQVEKPSQAVLPVFFNQADACLVSNRSFTTLSELNPQLGNDLAVLICSPPLLRGLVCLRSDLPKETKQDVVDILTRLHTEPEGKQTLMTFREERLIPFLSSYLETTRALFEEYNALQRLRAGGRHEAERIPAGAKLRSPSD
ncbi:MAG: hypothetical protein A2W03_14985 [Candidatus Aminicenantes bacterium RBG_16_63_16]|nr:MAG: hypothetical protein A2W03_14985 [Candidatus Aminicenantes bacterium RBG_16_63_16]